jgi:hypothetical protein
MPDSNEEEEDNKEVQEEHVTSVYRDKEVGADALKLDKERNSQAQVTLLLHQAPPAFSDSSTAAKSPQSPSHASCHHYL